MSDPILVTRNCILARRDLRDASIGATLTYKKRESNLRWVVKEIIGQLIRK